MRKLSDMRFFQVLKHSSESEADMKKIEEYYDDFVKALFLESKDPDNIFDFYNEQCYIRVELKSLIKETDYIDQQLPKYKCIQKVLELLDLQLNLTEKRLEHSIEKRSRTVSPKPTTPIDFDWTGYTAELIELGYALYASKRINNGDIGIKVIMEWLSNTFNTEIKDYYHVYHKMKYRAGDQTNFLDKMKEKLMDKINDDLK
ncbi:RteC protein [Mariniphaga anaerophila]|uniref:RteC protein n=1 Tax=Mariniphaga anaerophila TaxID=1484053 RepID=A0A1M4U1R4_9BACT|nr:RteC domain-containing protein [Mariniphaga anaerophila]SHE50600.1 RteC protein [Mariniphaga anaerophila]